MLENLRIHVFIALCDVSALPSIIFVGTNSFLLLAFFSVVRNLSRHVRVGWRWIGPIWPSVGSASSLLVSYIRGFRTLSKVPRISSTYVLQQEFMVKSLQGSVDPFFYHV